MLFLTVKVFLTDVHGAIELNSKEAEIKDSEGLSYVLISPHIRKKET